MKYYFYKKTSMEFTFSLDNIKDAARKFIDLINHHKVITFSGELGAGKTTFISTLCRVLGIQEVASSPTFALIHEYTGRNKSIIYHIDLYRIQNMQEVIDAGIEDCIRSNNLCFVEWPERAPDLFPDETVRGTLIIISDRERKLIVELPQ